MKDFCLTYLYVKKHAVTGKLYFGKTTAKDPIKYPGSGKYWSNHIDQLKLDRKFQMEIEGK